MITEELSIREGLEWSNTILASLSDTQTTFSLGANAEILFNQLLRVFLEVTGSEFGFIGELQKDSEMNELHMHAVRWFSNEFHSFEGEKSLQLHDLEKSHLPNLVDRVLKSSSPVIDYFPSHPTEMVDDHSLQPTIHSFMGLPFASRGNLVGMVCVLNCPGGYEDSLRKKLAPLLNTCSTLINAFRVNSERRQAQENLKRYEQIIDVSVDAISLVNSDFRYMIVNQAYAGRFNHKVAEVVGKSVFEILPTTMHSGMRSDLAHCFEGGRRNFEAWIDYPTGRGYMNVRYDPLVDKGLVVGVVVVARDVLHLKEHREKLVLSQVSLDGMRDAVFWIGPKGNFVYVNRAACETLGYSDSELLEKQLWDIDPGFSSTRWTEHWKEMQIRRYTRFESSMKTKSGGHVPVELVSNLIETEEKSFLVALARDDRQRKQYEENLIKIAEGISGETGGLFNDRLTTYLAEFLNAEFVFLGELNELEGQIKSISVCNEGHIVDNFTYGINDAPCNKVVEQKIWIHPSGIQEKFPHYKLLKDLKVEGYAGAALIDSRGKSSGVLVALYQKPMTGVDVAEHFLQIFAARAASELEREYTLKALKLSQERLDMALQGASLGFWDWNMETDHLIYNAKFAELVGLENDGLESNINKFFDQLHPTDKNSLKTKVFSGLTPGQNHFEGNFRIAREDGYWYWVQLDGRVFGWKDNNPVRAVGIMMDINTTKRVADDLNALRHSQQLILNNAGEGIYGLDLYGHATFVNPAAERMLGWSLTDLIGNSLHDYMHHSKPDGSAYPVNECPISMTCADGQVHHQNSDVFWRKDGSSFPVEYTSTPIRDEVSNLIGAVVVFRDISERIKSEEDRRRLESQLRQAKKMEAVGQLTGGIAHDFNNILGSMLGFTSLAHLQAKKIENNNLLRYLDEIETAGKRARDLVSKLMIFSHSAKRIPENTVVYKVVDESVRLLRPTIPTSIAMNTYYAQGTEEVSVFADPIHIQQVVMNLCINARDALEGNGEIRVELKKTRVINQVCTSCQSTLDGDYLELTVQDNGCGIPEDQINSIFDPFFTTKEAGKGTGMGLAMVHSLLHESNAHIRLDAVNSGGCIFRVYFTDLQQDGVSKNEGLPNAEALIVPQRAHIMVVDDETAIGRFLKEYLGNFGYHVSWYSDGREALQAFCSDIHTVDLVVTDQTMPNLTGAELSRAILELNPDIPVILCSGYTDQVNQSNIAHFGIKSFFHKPVEPKALVEEINRLLSDKKQKMH